MKINVFISCFYSVAKRRRVSDSTAVEEIIELTEKIFKSRIISQEGPGRPVGHVLPSEIFTATRVTTKK